MDVAEGWGGTSLLQIQRPSASLQTDRRAFRSACRLLSSLLLPAGCRRALSRRAYTPEQRAAHPTAGSAPPPAPPATSQLGCPDRRARGGRSWPRPNWAGAAGPHLPRFPGRWGRRAAAGTRGRPPSPRRALPPRGGLNLPRARRRGASGGAPPGKHRPRGAPPARSPLLSPRRSPPACALGSPAAHPRPVFQPCSSSAVTARGAGGLFAVRLMSEPQRGNFPDGSGRPGGASLPPLPPPPARRCRGLALGGGTGKGWFQRAL